MLAYVGIFTLVLLDSSLCLVACALVLLFAVAGEFNSGGAISFIFVLLLNVVLRVFSVGLSLLTSTLSILGGFVLRLLALTCTCTMLLAVVLAGFLPWTLLGLPSLSLYSTLPALSCLSLPDVSTAFAVLYSDVLIIFKRRRRGSLPGPLAGPSPPGTQEVVGVGVQQSWRAL